MNLAQNIQVYVKTTGTCNLDCSHCFTSGSKGKNIFFDPDQTFIFLERLVSTYNIKSMRLLFHGGEPMITPVPVVMDFYNKSRTLNTHVEYGIQTNLVYKLSKEKINFINTVFKTGIGTSWDPFIRFGSTNKKLKSHQERLWEENVKLLSSQNHSISLMVCLSKDLLDNYTPEVVIRYAISLGINYIQFERITLDGNTSLNPNILPTNNEVDQWLLEMYQVSKKNQFYKFIGNMFLNEIATSFITASHIGNRCRNCEQHLITINADGTLGGCPNSATDQTWGNIKEPIDFFLKSPARVTAICHEKERNLSCFSCEVRYACNGDCYKLPWHGETCPAPKSILKLIHEENNFTYLENFII